jgi:predicted nuclease with TOPRIM domain
MEPASTEQVAAAIGATGVLGIIVGAIGHYFKVRRQVRQDRAAGLHDGTLKEALLEVREDLKRTRERVQHLEDRLGIEIEARQNAQGEVITLRARVSSLEAEVESRGRKLQATEAESAAAALRVAELEAQVRLLTREVRNGRAVGPA